MQGIHIEGRRWFQRTYGNTYHSVRIFADDKLLVFLPFQYGYGEQWLQTALDWLRENKYIPDECQRCGRNKISHNAPESLHGFIGYYGTQYLREVLHGTYSVIDVIRRKDL